jgi:hypothetical protein
MYAVCSFDKNDLDSGETLGKSYKTSKSIGYGGFLHKTRRHAIE